MVGMESMLSPNGVRFIEMVDALDLERLETRYTFMDEEEFRELLSRDVSKGMLVYWTETLQRAHLTAVTAILRSRHWLSGVQHATREKNLLVFAAAFRGLMESAADASTALIGTPLTLAHCHSLITEALEGGATTVSVSSELENELIHYSHGRRITGPDRANAPRSHRVRQVQDYRQIFGEQKAENVGQCYNDLCDLVHPGASSVWMWLDAVDAAGLEFRLSTQRDEALIAGFLRQYPTIPLELLMFAFNAPAMTLNVLNYFPVEDLHTPQLLNWHLDGIPAWTECRDELDGRGVRPMASAL